jgi:hypothetical protein
VSSPYINRFIQPDSIIPNPANPQSWNRYSYVLNSPINLSDPSGHESVCGQADSDPECEGVPHKPSVAPPIEKNDEKQTDVTEWLVDELNTQVTSGNLSNSSNCNSGPPLACAGLLYGSHFTLFGNTGIYNIKIPMLEEFANGAVVLCGKNSCRWVDYSAPGNVMFGVLSSHRGINQKIAWAAGGGLELYDSFKKGSAYTGTPAAWFDNPGDKAAVDWGWEFGNAHPNGFTLDEFKDALTSDVLNSFQAPPPGIYPAAQSQPNNYPPGYFLQP